VRIEFEFRSSGVPSGPRDGGHDPEECELVVCWIHEWTECPVDVLELRTTLRDLARETPEGEET
jgi:hypothetical protein